MEMMLPTPAQKAAITRANNRAAAQAAQTERQLAEQAARETQQWAELLALEATLAPLRRATGLGVANWGEWRPVPGYGMTLRERFARQPEAIWVLGALGDGSPMRVQASRVQRHIFATEWGVGYEPCSRYYEIFTVDTTPGGHGHGDQLWDYSTRSSSLRWLCAASREQLCAAATRLLVTQLDKAQREVGKLTQHLYSLQQP